MLGSRKWLYVLPNAFTLGCLFCGIYSMSLSAGDPTPARLYGAAIAILFGMLFDGCDGRVARLTRTQSDFGMQLDSLADVVTFGAAPAMLLWKWALAPLGFPGLFIAFTFAACGALRLARFNVLEMRGSKGSSAYFVGLPIPLAAGMVVALVIAHHKALGEAEVPALPVAALTILLGYLMISTVRYRTFKTVRIASPRSALTLLLVVTSAVAITLQFRASLTLLVFATLYVLAGLAEELVFFRRRRAERLAARATASGALEAALIDDDDEDGPFEEDAR